jgi:hypothetical protein
MRSQKLRTRVGFFALACTLVSCTFPGGQLTPRPITPTDLLEIASAPVPQLAVTSSPVTEETITLSPLPKDNIVRNDPSLFVWNLRYVANRGGGPDGVRLADFNGDGLMDITTSFESSGDIYLFLHPGIGNLESEWPFVIVGSVPRGEDAFGIDLDGDGAMDVVSAHEGDTLGMYVHWALIDSASMLNGDAWRTELIPSTRGKAWMYAIPLDVNLDGATDIVLGAKDDYYNSRNAVGDIGWLEAPSGDKRILGNWVYHTMDHAGWPMSIIAHDVDADGDPDIMLTDRNSDEEHMGARWLENPGQNWEEQWVSHFFPGLEGSRPGFMGFGDFDNDGAVDYMFSLWAEKEMAIVNGGADELTRIPLPEADTNGGPKGTEVGDIDLDGDLDVIVTFDKGELNVEWLEFTGSPFASDWQWSTIYDTYDGKFDQAILYDVDQDGDLDVMTTEEVQGLGVIWFENPTITLQQ